MNVVITGANKGIGFSLVSKFLSHAKEGDIIFALSRSIEQLSQINDSRGILIVIKCDLTNETELDNALNVIKENCNIIDYLINNAGLVLNKPFNEIKRKEIDEVFDINFKAPFILIQKLLPLLLLAKNGHIVNVSSMGGFQGAAKFQGLSAYSSSKAAIACLSECLAQEFIGTNIKVNALCIGAVETEMLAKAFPDYKAPIESHEMAEFIHHFTCFQGQFINGKVLPVALTTP